MRPAPAAQPVFRFFMMLRTLCSSDRTDAPHTSCTQILIDLAARQTKHDAARTSSADERESVATASNLYASEVQRIVRTKGSVAVCPRWE
jgi:hypothetical protein